MHRLKKANNILKRNKENAEGQDSFDNTPGDPFLGTCTKIHPHHPTGTKKKAKQPIRFYRHVRVETGQQMVKCHTSDRCYKCSHQCRTGNRENRQADNRYEERRNNGAAANTVYSTDNSHHKANAVYNNR